MLAEITDVFAEPSLIRAVLKEHRQAGTPVQIHPLGFLRVPLTSQDRLDEGFYLHVWPGPTTLQLQASSQVHNHVFDLESRILVGTLRNREYEAFEDIGGEWVLAEAIYAGSRSSRVPTGARIGYRLVHEQTYGPGEVYTIPKGVFHETDILQTPTATLMRKSNVDRSHHPINIMPVSGEPDVASGFDHLDLSQQTAWDIVLNLTTSLAS